MPFNIAVSGIKAAGADLNVIGNNIANAGTTGFKQSRAEFADVYATSNGIAANTPGSGVRLARVAQQFTQGNVSFTDNPLDLAVNGDGFFMVDDNGSEVYTRAGAFGLDREGYISNASGQRLVGYQTDGSGKVTGSLGQLNISTADIPPRATTGMKLGLNLDADSPVPTVAFDPTDSDSYNNATSNTIYDSLGNSHLATMYYRKTAANTWETHTYVDGAQVDGPDPLQFSTTGALTVPAGGTLTTASFTASGGGAPMTLTLDYRTATQFGSAFSVNALTQDGYTTGRLSGLDIDSQGVLFGRFTNGQSQVQGQVALANFANVQGLQPLGDTSWAETFSSGAALVGSPGTSSLGLLQSGALEESNVDLSTQLVKMIIAQRNYQANAEVISTADAVTQSIINIR